MTTSAGWGAEQWGVDGWSGAAATMVVDHAYAISTNEVVVVLSKGPMDVNGFVSGDVSNPGSWRVSIPATGVVLDIAGVRPYAKPREWVVRTLQRLPDSTVVCRVTASALRDAAGGITGAPNSADFAGVTEFATSTPQQLAATKAGGRDLVNTPAPEVDGTNVSGALVVVGGDYALQDGAELVKKLIVRRLLSTPGEFFHLQDYGVGFRVKQPIPGGGMVRLKTKIERQLLREPDIESVRVQLSQTQNVLTCFVSAVLARTGQQVNVSVASPIGAS